MADPWMFGLGVAGLILTAVLGGLGLRTLEKWRHEKIEEKKIELALDALSLAYESKGVFEGIRSRLASSSEWADMAEMPSEDERERKRRGSYYAIMKRIQFHRGFFERAWAMQPRCTALFGTNAEDTFLQLHKARRAIEIACEMLTNVVKQPEDDEQLWFQLRADIWGSHGASRAKEPDRVDKMLDEFRTGMERLCRPTLANKSKRERKYWFLPS
jgi:hypothetical protein